MIAPLYYALDGHVVVNGYAPDGDSIRFAPNDPANLSKLRRSALIRMSEKDCSIQLRLEGIDSPELHYAAAAQPRGGAARDALLRWLGVSGVTCAVDGSTITSSAPTSVPAQILTNAADPHGRLIAYLLRKGPRPVPGAPGALPPRRRRVDEAVLRETANYALLQEGHAYLLAYTSLPSVHRAVLRAAARAARTRHLGVWQRDVTSRGFALRGKRSIGPGGALIFPKLFRRCIDYLAQKAVGYSGTFVDWLSVHGSGGSLSPDRVVTPHAANVSLASLIRESKASIALVSDISDLVFVEE